MRMASAPKVIIGFADVRTMNTISMHLLYVLFSWVFLRMLQAAHKGALSHPKCICDQVAQALRSE